METTNSPPPSAAIPIRLPETLAIPPLNPPTPAIPIPKSAANPPPPTAPIPTRLPKTLAVPTLNPTASASNKPLSTASLVGLRLPEALPATSLLAATVRSSPQYARHTPQFSTVRSSSPSFWITARDATSPDPANIGVCSIGTDRERCNAARRKRYHERLAMETLEEKELRLSKQHAQYQHRKSQLGQAGTSAHQQTGYENNSSTSAPGGSTTTQYLGLQTSPDHYPDCVQVPTQESDHDQHGNIDDALA